MMNIVGNFWRSFGIANQCVQHSGTHWLLLYQTITKETPNVSIYTYLIIISILFTGSFFDNNAKDKDKA